MIAPDGRVQSTPAFRAMGPPLIRRAKQKKNGLEGFERITKQKEQKILNCALGVANT